MDDLDYQQLLNVAKGLHRLSDKETDELDRRIAQARVELEADVIRAHNDEAQRSEADRLLAELDAVQSQPNVSANREKRRALRQRLIALGEIESQDDAVMSRLAANWK